MMMMGYRDKKDGRWKCFECGMPEDDDVWVRDLAWKPIDKTTPRDRFLLLRGPSGMSTTPHRYILGRYETDRGAVKEIYNWRDHSGDAVTDGGEMPTEWCEL